MSDLRKNSASMPLLADLSYSDGASRSSRHSEMSPLARSTSVRTPGSDRSLRAFALKQHRAIADKYNGSDLDRDRRLERLSITELRAEMFDAAVADLDGFMRSPEATSRIVDVLRELESDESFLASVLCRPNANNNVDGVDSHTNWIADLKESFETIKSKKVCENVKYNQNDDVVDVASLRRVVRRRIAAARRALDSSNDDSPPPAASNRIKSTPRSLLSSSEYLLRTDVGMAPDEQPVDQLRRHVSAAHAGDTYTRKQTSSERRNTDPDDADDDDAFQSPIYTQSDSGTLSPFVARRLAANVSSRDAINAHSSHLLGSSPTARRASFNYGDTSSLDRDELPSRPVLSVAYDVGQRAAMEDTFTAVPHAELFLPVRSDESGPVQATVMGVFDGHAGRLASRYARSQLVHALINDPAFPHDFETAAARSFALVNERFCSRARHLQVRAGTTAVIIAVINDELMLANVGDSESVLCRDGKAVPLTRRHVPSSPRERQRVENSGTRVRHFMGTWRVEGTMAVSRSIGDCHLPILSPLPHTARVKLHAARDAFVVSASDGLFDVMSPAEVVEFVTPYASSRKGRAAAARALVDHALHLQSRDNVCVVIAFFKDACQNLETNSFVSCSEDEDAKPAFRRRLSTSAPRRLIAGRTSPFPFVTSSKTLPFAPPDSPSNDLWRTAEYEASSHTSPLHHDEPVRRTRPLDTSGFTLTTDISESDDLEEPLGLSVADESSDVTSSSDIASNADVAPPHTHQVGLLPQVTSRVRSRWRSKAKRRKKARQRARRAEREATRAAAREQAAAAAAAAAVDGNDRTTAVSSSSKQSTPRDSDVELVKSVSSGSSDSKGKHDALRKSTAKPSSALRRHNSSDKRHSSHGEHRHSGHNSPRHRSSTKHRRARHRHGGKHELRGSSDAKRKSSNDVEHNKTSTSKKRGGSYIKKAKSAIRHKTDVVDNAKPLRAGKTVGFATALTNIPPVESSDASRVRSNSFSEGSQKSKSKSSCSSSSKKPKDNLSASQQRRHELSQQVNQQRRNANMTGEVLYTHQTATSSMSVDIQEDRRDSIGRSMDMSSTHRSSSSSVLLSSTSMSKDKTMVMSVPSSLRRGSDDDSRRHSFSEIELNRENTSSRTHTTSALSSESSTLSDAAVVGAPASATPPLAPSNPSSSVAVSSLATSSSTDDSSTASTSSSSSSSSSSSFNVATAAAATTSLLAWFSCIACK